MAQFGLGNFLYEVTFDGKAANFLFRDPEDETNTAEVSVSREDFPEGVTQADSRQVADVAYDLVAKTLNDKRDERIKAEALKATEAQLEKEAHEREVANDFLSKAQDLGDTTPTGSQPEEKEDIPAAPHKSPEEVAKENSTPDDSKKKDDKKKK